MWNRDRDAVSWKWRKKEEERKENEAAQCFQGIFDGRQFIIKKIFSNQMELCCLWESGTKFNDYISNFHPSTKKNKEPILWKKIMKKSLCNFSSPSSLLDYTYKICISAWASKIQKEMVDPKWAYDCAKTP